MKIELFLVRHGETTANRDNILQGHSDFPLTDRGQEEASKVGDVFSNYNWSKAYTSDLNRAIKTSIIVFSKSSQDLPLNTDSLLREINFGVLEGLPRNTKLEEAKKIISKRDGIPIEDIDDISESRDDVVIRQRNFIDNIYKELESESLQSNNPNEVHKVLVISHGGYIKLFIKSLCNFPRVNTICNGSITRVIVDKNQATGEYQYIINENEINCYEHLVGDKQSYTNIYNWSNI
mmetsp:Transcript_12217/g.11051  ORF Transcript_12217/g.11051 Transcript_12217/m.11051 type:complete len:235 (-) Transcript_12217:34-738(-)